MLLCTFSVSRPKSRAQLSSKVSKDAMGILHSHFWDQKQPCPCIVEAPQVLVVIERPLFRANTVVVVATVGNKQQGRVKNGSIWIVLSSVATSSREAAGFVLATLSLVQSLIARTDECPDLLVAD